MPSYFSHSPDGVPACHDDRAWPQVVQPHRRPSVVGAAQTSGGAPDVFWCAVRRMAQHAPVHSTRFVRETIRRHRLSFLRRLSRGCHRARCGTCFRCVDVVPYLYYIYTIILLKSVSVRKLQVAILARSSREMSLTVRIV